MSWTVTSATPWASNKSIAVRAIWRRTASRACSRGVGCAVSSMALILVLPGHEGQTLPFMAYAARYDERRTGGAPGRPAGTRGRGERVRADGRYARGRGSGPG